MNLRTDYARFYDRRPDALPPPQHRPYLLGQSRREVAEQGGNRAFPIFLHASAQFGFSRGEQDLLRCALGGETDEELAASLCLSVSTVKKRWLAIYDRVLDAAPALLGGREAGAEGRRGAERRRHLLNYLHEHAEELNPVYAEK